MIEPVTVESLASAVESLATVIALAGAAWWTFLLFVKKRERYPRARTTHSLILLDEVECYSLLRLSVKVENLGNVLLDLCRGRVRIQVVRPAPEEMRQALLRGEDLPRVEGYEFSWPDMDKFTLEWGKNGYRIEPLESEEFYFDFKVAIDVEAVQVYSYFQNVTEKRKEIGWNCTTVQDVQGGKDGRQAKDSVRSSAAEAGESSSAKALAGPTEESINQARAAQGRKIGRSRR
jgi:hypothetical protein